MTTSNVLYSPRPGSLASSVIGFFTNNPGEELDLDAIVEKFGSTRGNIHTQLVGALDVGMVIRERNQDGDYIYKAGPALSKANSKALTQFWNLPLPAPKNLLLQRNHRPSRHLCPVWMLW